MARIFITGSADGLGRAAAQTLLAAGTRSSSTPAALSGLAAVNDLIGRGATAVVGDLADLNQTRAVADQVNQLGRGRRGDPQRRRLQRPAGPAGQRRRALPAHRPDRPPAAPRVPQQRHAPRRTSRPGRHGLERTAPDRLLLRQQAVRHHPRRRCRPLWPDVYSNAVDPGWVPTRMGGPAAPDDLRLGHLTQEWLATSDEPEARTSGGYWFHQRLRAPHPAVRDTHFQDSLLAELARFTAAPLN